MMNGTGNLPIAVSQFPTARPAGPSLGVEELTTWDALTRLFQQRREGPKDGVSFVPATFKPDPDGQVRRLKDNLRARTAVVLDIETHQETGEVPPSVAEVVARLGANGWAAAVYTSHSHTRAAPRYRIVLPLSAEITPDLPAVEVIADRLGVYGVLDESKIGASSLFYLPSADPGHMAHHETTVIDGTPIDAAWMQDRAGAVLSAREAERARQHAEAMDAASRRREERARQGFDPNASIIEAIRDHLDMAGELIGHGYQPAGDKRYLYRGSESGVPGVYVLTGRDGIERVYSHHSGDPLAPGNLPAWCRVTALDVVDVLTILDHGGDQKAALRILATRFGLRTPRSSMKLSKANGKGTDAPPNGASSGVAADAAGDDGLVTEGSVADAFTREHRGDLRFCHHTGAWFVWSGAIWKKEETKLAYRWAHRLARDLAKDSLKATVVQAGKASFAAGVERIAQSARVFAVTSEIWNTDPWLLGTPGGTVNLRTGELRPARQADYITKQTAVAPAERADCPLWLAFLDQATAGDSEFVGFVRRWFGLCLTGITREHALLFVYGDGGNGKGVLMLTMAGIMGGYAVNAAMDSFTVSRSDKHPTDMAMLTGARLVMSTEVDEGQVWAEARLKSLTGGDPITARFMRRDFFTFIPEFKLTISGNHKPSLRNVDAAAKRRFNLAPFTNKPAAPDKKLTESLKAEWPAILRWMLDGCLEWQRDGLQQPAVVRAATEEYFAAQDIVGRWLEECCTLHPSFQMRPGALTAECRKWAVENGEEPPTSSAFRGAMERTPGIRYGTTRGLSWIRGVALKPRPQRAEEGDGVEEGGSENH